MGTSRDYGIKNKGNTDLDASRNRQQERFVRRFFSFTFTRNGGTFCHLGWEKRIELVMFHELVTF
ncbi:Uncharacterised protein [Vibrio cholerae]|nr:Uncharacterised protein [Vibrio cholerae]CSB25615.1 Uncharacterised protein [Vibrio cholerae]